MRAESGPGICRLIRKELEPCLDAFIHAFGSTAIDSSYFAPTSFISDDLTMLLKVELRTESDPIGAATVLGQAFIQVHVPEPSTGLLALIGLCAPAVRRRHCGVGGV